MGGNVLPSLLFTLDWVTISDSRKGWLDKGNENVLNILLERFLWGVNVQCSIKFMCSDGILIFNNLCVFSQMKFYRETGEYRFCLRLGLFYG